MGTDLAAPHRKSGYQRSDGSISVASPPLRSSMIVTDTLVDFLR